MTRPEPIAPGRRARRWLLLLEVLLVSTLPLSAADPSSPSPDTFLEALAARSGPSPELGAAAEVYDWLVGSWDAEVTDLPADGPPRHGRGEWHFAWVLEGRALQDVWIVPPRGERSTEPTAPAPGNRYGSTLRIFDPEAGVWRITWINPVTGVESRLTGRRVGRDLVHEGVDSEGAQMRWIFTDIEPAIGSGEAPRSFRWLGESSRDGGETWRLEAEFRAVRRSDPEPPSTLARRWEWTDRPGLESLEIELRAEEIVADGAVLVVLDGVPTQVRYRLTYDRSWRFLRASIRSRAGSPGGEEPAAERRLEIARDPSAEEAAWRVDGEPRPDLDGCADIDLMVTPFTNTPPLRSQPLAPGEARTLTVAWLRWPELTVRAVEQEYRRLDEARYRYRNLDSGFEGELTVDDDLLVTEYGPWRALR